MKWSDASWMLYGDRVITLRRGVAVPGSATNTTEDLHHRMDRESTGMLRHAIAPMRRFTKASHDVVRHQVLNSDAKILLLYVQGLPESELGRPLGAYALKLGIKGRAYQRVKQSLTACGYLHEWRWQGERGRWVTEQLLTNVALTPEEAGGVRDGADGVRGGSPSPGPGDPPDPGGPSGPAHTESPSVRAPVAGEPERRKVGGSYREEQLLKKNLPHPPPEALADPTPELLAAERVLLSLRSTSRELHLGVGEARQLAETAAEWLRRGVSAGELRTALTAGLPSAGIRSAVGFLRHRLVAKLPAEAVPVSGPGVEAGAAGLVVCRGPGDEHVFRPVAGETHCRRCRTGDANRTAEQAVSVTPWRVRVAALSGPFRNSLGGIRPPGRRRILGVGGLYPVAELRIPADEQTGPGVVVMARRPV